MLQPQREDEVPAQAREDERGERPPPAGSSARPSSAAVTSETAPASAEGRRTPSTVVPNARESAR